MHFLRVLVPLSSRPAQIFTQPGLLQDSPEQPRLQRPSTSFSQSHCSGLSPTAIHLSEPELPEGSLARQHIAAALGPLFGHMYVTVESGTEPLGRKQFAAKILETHKKKTESLVKYILIIEKDMIFRENDNGGRRNVLYFGIGGRLDCTDNRGSNEADHRACSYCCILKRCWANDGLRKARGEAECNTSFGVESRLSGIEQ